MLLTVAFNPLNIYVVFFLSSIFKFIEANAEISFLEYANLTNYYEELTYEPCKYSFLEYMLKLKDIDEEKNATSELFKNECIKPNYQLSTYHALVYLYVCVFKNQQIFKLFCSNLQDPSKNLQSTLTELLALNSSSFNGSVFEPKSFHQELSNVACHYIDNYVSVRENFKKTVKENLNIQPNGSISLKYDENLLEDVPFCIPFSCPYWKNGEKVTSFTQTVYECMPMSCQVVFWVILILDVIFAVAIIAANMIIITVVKKTPQLLTPHGYFSLSLALADLVVGVVTEPCIVYNFYVTYRGPISTPVNTNQWYLNISGFFTALSLCASLLSLLGTAAFRFLALVKPNLYWRRRKKVKTIASYVIIGIWIFSACLGLLPILRIIPGEEYFIHPVGMTLSQKMDKLYLYSAALCFGLLVVWILTMLPWVVMRRKKKKQRNARKRMYRDTLALSSGIHMNSKFKKLDKTLKVVVAAFTISYLPLVITQSFAKSTLINLCEHPKSFNMQFNYAWNVAMFLSSRFVLANSFANCIIYNVKNKEFLGSARRIFNNSVLKKRYSSSQPARQK